MTKDTTLSETVENHLKAIYYLSQEDEGASNQRIAARLGITGAGVTKMLHTLAKHRLATHTPYQRVHLTPLGEKVALELIRHHRLIELYLMETLGYGWEHVHAEAERLEHHISEEFEESIERILGFPEFDPHGDPIPSRDGIMPHFAKQTLASHPDGAEVVVRRVTDEDPELLRYLGERNLRPGTQARIVAHEPFGGSIVVCIVDKDERISPEAARNVFVELIDDPAATD